MVRVGLELARRDVIDYDTDRVRFLVSEGMIKIRLSVMAISKKPSVIEPGGWKRGLNRGTVSENGD